MDNKGFDNDNASQQKRLLQRLRQGPCSTCEARHELDIISPAARVFELRHKYDHNIVTNWTDGHNPGGGSHRIAQYVLVNGQWQGGKR